MEKLKEIVDTVEFLSRYPGWLKTTLGVWALGTLGLFVAMVVLYPKETAVRILKLSLVPDYARGVALQFRVANTSDQQAALVALELAFYATKVPPGAGSLQATESITGRYVVTGDAETGALRAAVNKETESLPVKIKFPLAGRKDYALVVLDLAQKIAAKGTDRFQVALEAVGLPPPGARYVEAILHYGENEKTRAVEIPLPE